ncbi:MAG: valine--tRNA ligase [Holosporales bacterium]|jgi:valyl-tRNA synthetase|nr:valine--tRNA ligase [Holosporales bacterium]
MIEKTFSPQQFEENVRQLWAESSPFALDSQKGGGEPYTIMLPPPNVTGSLHLGHALCFTLQDILVRYYRMQGRKVLWQPGLDHAGIVTQLLVERSLEKKGVKRTDIGRAAFIEEVWKWKEQSGGTIVEQMKRLGASCDWTRLRFTMDEGGQRAVRKAFIDLYEAGLIYRAKRLVNWDPKLKSALSDLEVVEREILGCLWSIRYSLTDGTGSLIIATTRPETLFGDTAVAVHPEDARYQSLIGKMVHVPLTDRIVPIIADSYADPEKGSGAVKITPAHDFNDFAVGERHSLPLINIFDDDWCLNDQVPETFRGLERSEARTRVIKSLAAAGLLEKEEPFQHKVPHGDRSGVILEPYLTDQWFVDTEKLAAPALQAAETENLHFVPENWVNTYYDWMRNIKPWCISRQIWWGHDIPAWYGPDEHAFVAYSLEEAQQKAQQHYGKAVVLRQDPDVLDTWFSSALWPFMTLGWPEKTPEMSVHYPGNVLVTGFDIIFFWIARMVMMGMHFCQGVPFKDVYIHPLVRDEKGQKMSKSRGNVIDPMELIQEYGADAVRIALAALCVPGRNIQIGRTQIESYRNFLTKIWNAARFSQLKSCKRDPSFDPARTTHPFAHWIIWEIHQLFQEVESALQNYRFDLYVQSLYHRVWGSFCDWYLELIKPLLEKGTPLAQEIRATTAWALEQILRIISPLTPFMTEELAALLEISQRGTLCQEHVSTPSVPASFQQSARGIDWVCALIKSVRSVRSLIRIPAGTELKVTFLPQEASVASLWETYKVFCARLARLCPVIGHPNKEVRTVPVVVEGGTLTLFVGEVIDAEAERKRLKTEEAALVTEEEKETARLVNPQFLEHAPQEVIEKGKKRLAEIAARRALLAPLLRSL